jgi:uncharacterized OB-fold protein
MSAPPAPATAAAPPQENPAFTPFLQGVQEGRLLLQRCRACGTAFAAGRLCCEACWSDDLAWEEAGGKATLYSFVVYRRQLHSAHPVPYHVAVAQLEEGPRMPCRVEAEPESLRAEMPLRLRVEDGLVKAAPAAG